VPAVRGANRTLIFNSIPETTSEVRFGERGLRLAESRASSSLEDEVSRTGRNAMLKVVSVISFTVALSTLGLLQLALAQSSAPNLGGAYRCQPQPDPCRWQSQAPAISQLGTKLDLKIDKNELAEGRLTSNITISAGPPYNANGLVMPDHSIEWSNGTKWIKQ
jgi:hypothetical protein